MQCRRCDDRAKGTWGSLCYFLPSGSLSQNDKKKFLSKWTMTATRQGRGPRDFQTSGKSAAQLGRWLVALAWHLAMKTRTT